MIESTQITKWSFLPDFIHIIFNLHYFARTEYPQIWK
jgi:hypothetical protein